MLVTPLGVKPSQTKGAPQVAEGNAAVDGGESGGGLPVDVSGGVAGGDESGTGGPEAP